MTDDLRTLAPALLANFMTVCLPVSERVWAFREWDLPPAAYNRCQENAVRCDRIVIGCHRNLLRFGLHEHGHRHFLDRLERTVGGDWRIHLFLADEAAVQLVPSLTPLEVGPGDPIRFDPQAFVKWRLRQIGILHQRTGRYDWLLDDGP